MPLPAAVVAGGLIGAAILWQSSPMDHDETVQATYDELNAVVPADATVYADHIDGAPNPHGEVKGLTHVPDVVVKAGSANSLIIEVETADSLENSRSEARSQLKDFSTPGYRRMLVVPPSEEDKEAVTSFLEEFDTLSGELYLAAPETAPDYL